MKALLCLVMALFGLLALQKTVEAHILRVALDNMQNTAESYLRTKHGKINPAYVCRPINRSIASK
jgi:hypothetical protein